MAGGNYEMEDFNSQAKIVSIDNGNSSKKLQLKYWIVIVLAFVTCSITMGLFIGGYAIYLASTPPVRTTTPLILISLDGFKVEYLDRGITPNIQTLINNGVRSEGLVSVFPTKTFPNHYSMVTGLYPESHGIIDNTIYDPDTGRKFELYGSEKMSPKWWGGEPIWLTAKKRGLVTGTFFWPGADVRIQGTDQPDYWIQYDASFPFHERLPMLLNWIDNVDRSPSFMTLYFNEPDTTGHGGSHSPKINDVIKRMDSIIGSLIDGLKTRMLLDKVNLMIVSDHGMKDLNCSKKFVYSSYNISTDYYQIVNGPVCRIGPKFSKKNKVDMTNQLINVGTNGLVTNLFEKVICKNKNIGVYHKQDLPVRYHYSNNRKIEPVVLVAEDGWYIGTERSRCDGATHGWDSKDADMTGLFLGHGPAFRKGVNISAFYNVQLYNVMCHLLGIPPAPNNGTRASLNEMLINEQQLEATIGRDIPPCDVADGNAGTGYQVSGELTTDKGKGAGARCNDDFERSVIENIENVKEMDDLKRFVSWKNGDVCYLKQPNYLTIYNAHSASPVAVSYRERSTTGGSACVIHDWRVPPSAKATLPLMYLDQGSNNGHSGRYSLSSTAVQVYPNVKDLPVWQFLDELHINWTADYGDVVKTAGVIHDHDSDGQADPDHGTVPSHLFRLYTLGPARIVIVVVPNSSTFQDPCLPMATFVKNYMVILADLQHLTGLQLNTSVPPARPPMFYLID